MISQNMDSSLGYIYYSNNMFAYAGEPMKGNAFVSF